MKRFLLLAAMVAIGGTASAAVTQYVYSGTILDGPEIDGINPFGATFSGSFYYDPDSPFQATVEIGRALFSGPSNESHAAAGQIVVSGPSSTVQLFDNYSGSIDMLVLQAIDNDTADLPPTIANVTSVISVILTGPITDMQLPRSIDLSSFSGRLDITGYSKVGAPFSSMLWSTNGAINHLAPIPEPSSALLLLAGLVMVAASVTHRGFCSAPPESAA